MSTVAISIPPFPSQDLAKLVLGYLAEEQLMTAYDEFLQASPYLDAFRNEYDRIFMTSLKNILAEYRAVKIYVETCKPFILRRKLFQCPNLLEIVKFLVNNVDINKLHLQEGNGDKVGQRQHSLSRCNVCEVCTSLKLLACVCRSNSHSTSQIEATTLESSVETTSLADLPGNILYKKNIAKVSANGSAVSHSITSSDQSRDVSVNTIKCPDNFVGTNIESSHTADDVISSVAGISYFQSPNLLAKDDSHSNHTGQNVHVLNLVSHSRKENLTKQDSYPSSPVCNTVCGAGTFQDFSTGVDSSTINKIIVPDSSTSENHILQSSSETESIRSSIKKDVRPQLLIKVSHDHTNTNVQANKPLSSFTKIATKESIGKSSNSAHNENSPKITILSDVKVDSDRNMPPVLKTATSTPLVQMQTLYINGTPAYKQAQQSYQNYTKDEIMAMPTIILVPATGTSKKIVPSVTQNNRLENKEYPAVTCSTGETLEPLVIDVSTPDSPGQIDDNEISDNNLVKTVEATGHMSLPKENNLPSLKTNTPHVLPPTRKSSSTPRRTSHIRVLDFATPRRILHETINEQGEAKKVSSNEANQPETSDLPVINDKSTEESKTKINTTLGTTSSSEETNNRIAKENKTTLKLYNWDANLRALAYAGSGNIEKSETTQKSKSKKAKKKVSPEGVDNEKPKDTKTANESKSSSNANEKNINTPKNRNTKSRKKSFEITKEIVNDAQDKASVSSVSVKPTINIISKNKWIDPVEIDKPSMKSNNNDDNLDTPELERMSLHNEIGAKLNISDLLETPYKQALYDIQMETPKFLGPDIPDDPLSDIKIMSIPTPRFLNTPKLTQNTPSSYSSRPTDYSSGGSYYKPDDQDYILATEVMECALSVSVETKKTHKESTGKVESVTKKGDEGKSRPVRQCTKNVSYNYSSNVVTNKHTDIIDDKTEKSSTCSGMSINKIDKIDKLKISKSDKDNKTGKKSEPKRKSKKYKSPIKKETPKTFMKIKPRRTTPVKESSVRGRKKASDISQNVHIKPVPKKISASKQKNCIIPELIPLSTKSRRKSSTPRKLNCTKILNVENTELNASDSNIIEPRLEVDKRSASEVDSNSHCNQDLETEQLILRWSDDGSQESAPKKTEDTVNVANDTDDITKIKEYINNTNLKTQTRNSLGGGEGTLQDLINRGFDVATARMIERDLLEVPSQIEPKQQIPIQFITQSIPSQISHTSKADESKTKSDKTNESDSSIVNHLQICIEEDDNDEFDLSVHESNENTNNYFSFQFNEAIFVQSDQVKLKETFSMEICIEDDESIRLRAMPFSVAFEQHPQEENVSDCPQKPSEGIESSCNLDTLYTPRKAQCYELFDSTLASLDTPLKSNSPRSQECETVSEIVLEVEKLENDTKQKSDKKRKRFQSESANGAKKAKTDYLLNSAIQNIDIETVLSKLHGP